MPYIHCYVALITMKELIILMIVLFVVVVISYFAAKRNNENIKNIQDYECREIEYDCLLLNEMWNKLSDKEKNEFFGNTITNIPTDFSDSLNNIDEIPDWCFR